MRRGPFPFLNLYPGSYALKAGLQGYSTSSTPTSASAWAARRIEITLSRRCKTSSPSPAGPRCSTSARSTGRQPPGGGARQGADRPRPLVAAQPGARRARRPHQRGRQRERPAVELPRPGPRAGQHLRGRRRRPDRHERGGRLGHLLRLRRLRGGAVHHLQRRRHRRHLRGHGQPGDQARHQRVARPGPLPAHRRRLPVRRRRARRRPHRDRWRSTAPTSAGRC